jgi:hypothetical protein
VARELFAKGDHLFKYDLKEAYHHIEILEEHRKFLGFSWNFENNEKYFVFNVHPFGLASAGHIFTKVLKEAIKVISFLTKSTFSLADSLFLKTTIFGISLNGIPYPFSITCKI